jgi:hypothetical protein
MWRRMRELLSLSPWSSFRMFYYLFTDFNGDAISSGGRRRMGTTSRKTRRFLIELNASNILHNIFLPFYTSSLRSLSPCGWLRPVFREIFIKFNFFVFSSCSQHLAPLGVLDRFAFHSVRFQFYFSGASSSRQRTVI